MAWPKLSETLEGPRSPERCQGCGAWPWATLERWREHDDDDKPTQVVIVLCDQCSGKPVADHPRLYSQLEPNEHHPGTMELCVLCRHREGVRCPIAGFNGGPGLEIRPGSNSIHIKASTRKLSGYHTIWARPKECSRRQVLAIVEG